MIKIMWIEQKLWMIKKIIYIDINNKKVKEFKTRIVLMLIIEILQRKTIIKNLSLGLIIKIIIRIKIKL